MSKIRKQKSKCDVIREKWIYTFWHFLKFSTGVHFIMGICADLSLASLMLSTGSLNTISNKILFQTKGINIGGEEQYYERPWLNTFVMFCGESMCMVIYLFVFIYYRFCHKTDLEEILASTGENSAQSKAYKFVTREEVMRDPTGGLRWKFPFIVAFFATCDLCATSLTGIGLVYCNASIIQIVRGFVIVFTMLFAWCILKRKPNCHQVLGVFYALVGLMMVGVSAVFSEKSEEGEGKSIIGTIIGIGLTLIAQIFWSIQFVFEEKMLKQNTVEVQPIPPLFLVGSEGIAGAILSAGIALPITTAIPGSDFGSYENMKNSFYMLFHNDFLLGIQFLYFVSIAFFNWSSFVYSKALSATSRTLVDALRTIVVWIVMVAVYYCTNARYGEDVSIWSILQGGGFMFMLLGTVTHNDIGSVGSKMTKCCSKRTNEVLEQYDANLNP